MDNEERTQSIKEKLVGDEETSPQGKISGPNESINSSLYPTTSMYSDVTNNYDMGEIPKLNGEEATQGDGENVKPEENLLSDDKNKPIVKSQVYLILLALSMAQGYLLMGFENTVFGNLYTYYIQQVFKIEEDSEAYTFYSSLLSVLHTGGATIGAFFASWLTSRFGYRNVFMVSDCMAILALVLYQVPILVLALAARFIIGVITGINSVTILSFISQIAPLEYMGRYSGFCLFFVNFAIFLTAGLGFGLSNNMGNWWRIMLGFPFFCPVIRFLYLKFIHKMESPRFYYMKGETESAKAALDLIYMPHRVQKQMNLLEEEKAKLMVLDSPIVSSMKTRRVWYIRIIFILQQLAGINAMVFYSYQFFKGIATDDNNNTNATLTSLLIFCFYTIDSSFAFISSFLFDIFGRKPVILTACTLTTIACTGLTVTYVISSLKIVTAGFLYLYIFGFTSGPGAGSYVTSADLVVKEKANAGFLMFWFFATLVTGVYPYAVKYLGARIVFGFFGVSALLLLLFFALFIKENRNKTEIEIAEMYSPKPRKRKNKETKV